MSDRRYDADETRAIFQQAAQLHPDAPEASAEVDRDGLTLEELQRIGLEVGIAPTQIAAAASALDHRGVAGPVRRVFGLPASVSRVVPLPRSPTEREWEQMVAGFRTMFGAVGESMTVGGLRTWTNGSLHMALEPTTDGEQLRMSTVSDTGVALHVLGAVTGAMAVLMGGVVIAAGKPEKFAAIVTLFGGLAVGAWVTNLLRLPRWARSTAAQMDATGARVVALLAKPERPTEDDHA